MISRTIYQLSKCSNLSIMRNTLYFSLKRYSSQPEKSKLRKFYDEYGKLGIGVYLTISVISVSSLYAAIKMGVNMDLLLEKFNLQDNKIITKAGPFALAYGIHKVFAPQTMCLFYHSYYGCLWWTRHV